MPLVEEQALLPLHCKEPSSTFQKFLWCHLCFHLFYMCQWPLNGYFWRPYWRQWWSSPHLKGFASPLEGHRRRRQIGHCSSAKLLHPGWYRSHSAGWSSWPFRSDLHRRCTPCWFWLFTANRGRSQSWKAVLWVPLFARHSQGYTVARWCVRPAQRRPRCYLKRDSSALILQLVAMQLGESSRAALKPHLAFARYTRTCLPVEKDIR